MSEVIERVAFRVPARPGAEWVITRRRYEIRVSFGGEVIAEGWYRLVQVTRIDDGNWWVVMER